MDGLGSGFLTLYTDSRKRSFVYVPTVREHSHLPLFCCLLSYEAAEDLPLMLKVGGAFPSLLATYSLDALMIRRLWK